MAKKKMVIKVTMRCDKCRTKALQIAAQTDGVESVKLKGEDDDATKDQIMVIGESVNVVALTKSLRKKVGNAELVSVTDFDEDEA
uniref:heavy metal-associated isoprenylated plant protein 16-like n=1 Tax=Erigeron canadensis TaxID=72917 RepID=UPI001CB8E720|nr:heavy metal-associated isoprenylated plant protein 16-like [Erigeron canadensis]